MLMQPVTTSSPHSLQRQTHFANYDVGFFNCAAELSGMSLNYARDEEIYGEGEDAEFVYKVAHGAVRTYKLLRDGRRQIGGFHLAGDLFGLDLGGRRHLTAEAVADSKVLVFKRRQVESVVAQNLAAARELWLTTANHLQHAEEHMLLLGRKTAIERLAAFLLEMDARSGQAGRIELPMLRRDIADYLGLTLETVSRSFSELQSAGVVELDGARHVVLRNRAALEEMGA
ncbi:helix-turn-helix domain-containing protein [Methylocapsa acidiphila]|uniref:helix-turn-helix domain-containing protein n=1 Tax=Methylocapsa acidiphila TaxID=133552 RepID=UPI0004119EC7|nr:helix-turn-helix domain-containing protein [Methylocapsa acidiphila]